MLAYPGTYSDMVKVGYAGSWISASWGRGLRLAGITWVRGWLHRKVSNQGEPSNGRDWVRYRQWDRAWKAIWRRTGYGSARNG